MYGCRSGRPARSRRTQPEPDPAATQPPTTPGMGQLTDRRLTSIMAAQSLAWIVKGHASLSDQLRLRSRASAVVKAVESASRLHACHA